MKRKIIIISSVCIVILCLCVAVYVAIKAEFCDKAFPNVALDFVPDTISECIHMSETALEIEDNNDYYVGHIGIYYEHLYDSRPSDVDITFVELVDTLWFDYIEYRATIDFKTGEICNIRKQYVTDRSVIFREKNVNDWNLDINNATNNEAVKNFINNHNIDDYQSLLITTAKNEWIYMLSDNEGQNMRVHFDATNMELERIEYSD